MRTTPIGMCQASQSTGRSRCTIARSCCPGWIRSLMTRSAHTISTWSAMTRMCSAPVWHLALLSTCPPSSLTGPASYLYRGFLPLFQGFHSRVSGSNGKNGVRYHDTISINNIHGTVNSMPWHMQSSPDHGIAGHSVTSKGSSNLLPR